MNYLDSLTDYEVVDVIESAINDMDLTGTEYEKKPFTYVHGLPLDVKNEHTNDKSAKLPVILCFEPLTISTSFDEMESEYKTGSVTLYFMDKLDRFGKAKQTKRSYEDVISLLGAVVRQFMDALNNRVETAEILNYNEVNYPDWAVNVEQRSGGNTTAKVMYQNLTGKEISFDIVTHKIYSCNT